MKKLIVPILAMILVLAMAGCNLMLGEKSSGTVSATDIAKFQRVFMSSYTAERGGRSGGAKALSPFLPARATSSKAAVPVNLLTNLSFASLSPLTFSGYPEPGQTTSFTAVVYDAANNVYDITATTTYAAGDNRKNYVEEYYIRDIGKNSSGFFDTATPDHVWTVDDPIVSWTGAAWVQDQKARVRQVLTFTDGTTRTEHIVSQTDFTQASPSPKFAAFDPNGSLSFGQLFIPATDTSAQFS
ncbi:MAG TPA: hypothetical protein VFH83_07750, partial [Spirochaetia bacterium]|nr:hypothetical protein [Spirochaetia bacterium]